MPQLTNKLFATEYAKSDRSSCKACKTKINKEELRLAVMVQSPHFDGKMPNWFHEKCFWIKARPKTVGDIHNYTNLRWADQELIKNKVNEYVDMPVESKRGKKGAAAKGTKKGKGKDADTGAVNLVNDFKVEYAKSNRSMCRGCEAKIAKDDVRIAKKDFESEEGMAYGGLDRWYHLSCFEACRHDLGYLLCGSKLPGFEKLKKDNKQEIKSKLAACTGVKKEDIKTELDGPGPSKKPRTALDEISDVELKKQNEEMFHVEDKLKDLNRNELTALIEHNKLISPGAGAPVLKKALADFFVFGKPTICNKCHEEGMFKYIEGVGYQCSGSIKEFTEYVDEGFLPCENIVKEPERAVMKIPAKLKKKYPILGEIKCGVGKRLIVQHEGTTSTVLTSGELSLVDSSNSMKVKSEPGTSKSTKVQRFLPLKDMLFYVYHSTSTTDKQDTVKRILDLGGDVASKIKPCTIAAIVTNKDKLKDDSKADTLETYDIHVVPKEFLYKCTNGDALKLIETMNIAPWGKDAKEKMELFKQEETSKSEQMKSKSVVSKSQSGTVKLQVKDGLAVDPESGLVSTADVYKKGKLAYSVVLSETDAAKNKNSYYKLQILKSRVQKHKFYVFRNWGRIGTTIGGTKKESFDDIEDAIEAFNFLYEEKTNNKFGSKKFTRVPGFMSLVEIEYEDKKSKIKDEVDSSDLKCSLDDKVANLIKLLFDETNMETTLKEFELDLEKMPLGKLSVKQIKEAYSLLAKLIDLVNKTDIDTDIKHKLFVQMTNSFYSLIPHCFGLDSPPILNNENIVKNKLDMLESMLQIELAYSMITSNVGGKHPIENCYEQLSAEIKVLNDSHEHHTTIMSYVQNTHAETHRQYDLNVQEIYEVQRKGESKRFKPFEKLGNKHLLWHGSRLTNFASIISKGLCIAPPEAPVTGYMFGKGIYFADSVSKSANYCMTNSTNNVGLLLLCEVALGNPMQRTHADFITKVPPPYNSVQGVGKTHPDPSNTITLDADVKVPLGKLVPNDVPNTSLLYNEFIVYDPAQVRIRYILKVQFDYKY